MVVLWSITYICYLDNFNFKQQGKIPYKNLFVGTNSNFFLLEKIHKDFWKVVSSYIDYRSKYCIFQITEKNTLELGGLISSHELGILLQNA